ncbi:MAG: hypothetical protein RIB61_05615 [Roseicyclus sp.]
MALFRIFVILAFVLIAVFTIAAVTREGADLLTPFVGPVLTMGWQGQFHVDFALYLIASALWVAWRSRFSGSGIVMALICGVMGMIVLAPYLLYLSYMSKGDMAVLLTGDRG